MNLTPSAGALANLDFAADTEFMFEIYLIVILAAGIAGMVNGAEGYGGLVLFVGAVLLFEKVISVYHSNHFLKEYILKDRTQGTVPGAQPV